MAVKMPTKSFRWKRQQLGERRFAIVLCFGQNHLPHGGDPVLLEEHVLGPAQSDTFGTKLASSFRVFWRIGIGANQQLAVIVGPFHDLGKVTRQFGGHGGHFAGHDLAGGAVERDARRHE